MSTPQITAIAWLPRFKKAYAKLEPRIQTEVNEVIQELLNNRVPNSRRFHKMGGYDDIWELRVTGNFRMSLTLSNSTAVLRNVGSHDHLLRAP